MVYGKLLLRAIFSGAERLISATSQFLNMDLVNTASAGTSKIRKTSNIKIKPSPCMHDMHLPVILEIPI